MKCHLLFGQNSVVEIIHQLNQAGFENIRGLASDKTLTLTYENSIFRDKVSGLSAVVDLLLESGYDSLKIVTLINDVPMIVTQIKTQDWKRYKSGELSSGEMSRQIRVSKQTDIVWKTIREEQPVNSNVNKIDLVIYPQFYIQNRITTQLYTIQFNMAPAMEISLWKGMLFTGQVIFPLLNGLEVQDIKENVDYRSRGFLYTTDEGHYIQPGFVTISQDIRLQHQWIGNITVGKFNYHRYGMNGRVSHLFNGDRWSITGNAGLTGSSHFLQGQWVTGSLNTFTWQATAGYFYPGFNVQVDLSYGSYINNDKGFRVDCSRHFRNTTIGFYAMDTGGFANGGFKFTVPFPTARRNRKHSHRVVAPKQFDSDYNAKYAVYYGLDYETRPNENQTEHFDNPLYIKDQLLKYRSN